MTRLSLITALSGILISTSLAADPPIKIGVLEDKAIKNMVATEFVYNYVKDKRTVGIIREDLEHGLVELAEPIGVILSLTPVTNPTSTVLFKCIMAIKTRNAMIFSPHPAGPDDDYAFVFRVLERR